MWEASLHFTAIYGALVFVLFQSLCPPPPFTEDRLLVMLSLHFRVSGSQGFGDLGFQSLVFQPLSFSLFLSMSVFHWFMVLQCLFISFLLRAVDASGWMSTFAVKYILQFNLQNKQKKRRKKKKTYHIIQQNTTDNVNNQTKDREHIFILYCIQFTCYKILEILMALLFYYNIE